jgi:hypothetical protein
MRKVWVVLLALALICPMIVSAADPAAAPAKPSVSSKLNVDFYGFIKLDSVYQYGYAVQDNTLAYGAPGNLVGSGAGARLPYFMRDEQTNKDFDSFSMTARMSRFGFVIKGPSTGSGLQTMGKIEADFYGSAPVRDQTKNQDPEENKGLFMLRIAYVEIGNDNFSLLAGNNWSLVSPIFPHTNNYPAGADIGNLGYRMPQVRLNLYALDKQLKLQVAAVNKIGDVDTLDIDTGRMNAAPTWEYGIVYTNKDNKAEIGYTGHNGNEEIRSTQKGKFGYYGAKVPSFSHNVHINLPLGDNFALAGEYFQGANLDGWYTGGQGNGWIINRDGHREPLHSQGGYGEIMIKPADKIKLYVGYGIDDVDNNQLRKAVIEKGYFNGNGNTAVTKNEMYFANLELYFNPATKVCLEYMQVISQYENAQHQAMAMAVPAGVTAPVRNHYAPGVIDRYTVSFWYMF